MKVKFTTILEDDILNKTKLYAKEKGVGGNAIIEKALRLYFSSNLSNQVWEKTLDSGWIKKVILHDDTVSFENIKCRKVFKTFKQEDFTEEALKERGWKKV